jgi:hypothetical protein
MTMFIDTAETKAVRKFLTKELDKAVSLVVSNTADDSISRKQARESVVEMRTIAWLHAAVSAFDCDPELKQRYSEAMTEARRYGVGDD